MILEVIVTLAFVRRRGSRYPVIAYIHMRGSLLTCIDSNVWQPLRETLVAMDSNHDLHASDT